MYSCTYNCKLIMKWLFLMTNRKNERLNLYMFWLYSTTVHIEMFRLVVIKISNYMLHLM